MFVAFFPCARGTESKLALPLVQLLLLSSLCCYVREPSQILLVLQEKCLLSHQKFLFKSIKDANLLLWQEMWQKYPPFHHYSFFNVLLW